GVAAVGQQLRNAAHFGEEVGQRHATAATEGDRTLGRACRQRGRPVVAGGTGAAVADDCRHAFDSPGRSCAPCGLRRNPRRQGRYFTLATRALQRTPPADAARPRPTPARTRPLRLAALPPRPAGGAPG